MFLCSKTFCDFNTFKMWPLFLILVYGVFSKNGARAQVRLVDGGYENVVVHIEDTVPETMCSGLFKGIEDTFKRASTVLYRATQRRTFFRNVSVVVPQSWTGSHCPRILVNSVPSMTAPDVSVGEPHPVYQNTPWTLQERGCGEPGKMIYLTQEFLAMRNQSGLGDLGRVLVHEWAKYRWGVFEEYGHEGDPIYPSYHRMDAHKYAPTGCSNVKVEGIPDSCDPQNQKCRFVPNQSQNGAVTSSLMYLHYLPHVTQFCDSTSHDPKAPTKQNAMCGHRSIWDVMKNHEDFANASLSGELTRDVTPTFTFSKEAQRRFVIVIEDTTVMNVQKRWDFLRKAVRKLLVYDLPPGHEVGVVLFEQASYVQLPLTTISDSLEERQRVATGSLPRNPSQVAPSQKCTVCGLKEAVKLLQSTSDTSAGDVVILISSGSPVPLSKIDVDQMAKVVKHGRIKLIPIMYPVTSRNPQPGPGVEELAKISGTPSFAVLDEGIGSDSKVSMMVSLMTAIHAALRIFLPSAKSLPMIIHTKEYPGGISSISEGYFDVDQTLGGEVQFCLTFYNLGHVGNMINLIDPSGKVLNSNDLAEEDGDVNMIFVTLRMQWLDDGAIGLRIGRTVTKVYSYKS